MSETIHMCTEMQLPPELIGEANQRAIEENPANDRSAGADDGGSGRDRLALPTGKMWKSGRTLRVRFLDGDSYVQQKVQHYAMEWTKYANINIVFGNDPNAEIRISFTRGAGSWSYLGTDNLSIAKNKPTMNFGWFDANTSDTEFSRTTIHEFGHALGCIHEHQNPSTNIPWNKEAVYAYYGGPPNNWSRAQVDNNLFRRYSATTTQYSGFDRQSIMLYAIDNSLTNGNYSVGWNAKLSPTDKSYINEVYPFPESSFDTSYYYRLTTMWQGEGRSLDIVNDGTNRTPILADTGNYSGQYWKLTKMGDYYRLTTMWQGDGRSLDIVNDDQDRTPILADTGNYSGQYWKITELSGGYHRLTTMWQGAGRSLDIINDGNNRRVILADTGNYSGQYWMLTKSNHRV